MYLHYLKLMESTEGSKIFVKINKAFTLQLGTGDLNHFLCGWLSIQGSSSYSSAQPLHEKSLGPLSSEANPFSLLVNAFQIPLQPLPLLIHKYWEQVFSRSILIAILPSPNVLTLIRPYVLILARGGGGTITLVYEITEKPLTNI